MILTPTIRIIFRDISKMNGLIDYQCEVHESGYEMIRVEIDAKYLATSELDDKYVEYIKPLSNCEVRQYLHAVASVVCTRAL